MWLQQQPEKKLRAFKKRQLRKQKTPLSVRGGLQSVIWVRPLYCLAWSPMQCKVQGIIQDDPVAGEPLIARKALRKRNCGQLPRGAEHPPSLPWEPEHVLPSGYQWGRSGCPRTGVQTRDPCSCWVRSCPTRGPNHQVFCPNTHVVHV